MTIAEGYGLTEAGIVTQNPPEATIKTGSIGTTMPGFTVSIRDDDFAEVGPGELGQLWVDSPTALVDYWGDPEATSTVWRDGWLDTGDVVTCDDDGYLWFQGRRKQIIVHDDSNISPQEVEGALREHPAVAGAGVVGVFDPVHGEDVRAYVTLHPDVARPTADELIRFARQRVGYKAPESIHVLKEMPLNPVGKIDRPALKRLANASVHG